MQGRRLRKLLVVLAGLAVVATVGAVVLWPRAERVTPENVERLRVGMTQNEVEAIIGLPGDHSTQETVVMPMNTESWCDVIGETNPNERKARWIGDKTWVDVAFDKTGHVTFLQLGKRGVVDHGALGNLLWRVKRQWRRLFPE
jgi:hypothetical protein